MFHYCFLNATEMVVGINSALYGDEKYKWFIDGYDIVVVNYGNGRGVVMISLDEYNSLKEIVVKSLDNILGNISFFVEFYYICFYNQ